MITLKSIYLNDIPPSLEELKMHNWKKKNWFDN